MIHCLVTIERDHAIDILERLIRGDVANSKRRPAVGRKRRRRNEFDSDGGNTRPLRRPTLSPNARPTTSSTRSETYASPATYHNHFMHPPAGGALNVQVD